tara:strand:+ start:581 stop:829 length:249 start_codon:yes stop_codon:yes gene_type:complete
MNDQRIAEEFDVSRIANELFNLSREEILGAETWGSVDWDGILMEEYHTIYFRDGSEVANSVMAQVKKKIMGIAYIAARGVAS